MVRFLVPLHLPLEEFLGCIVMVEMHCKKVLVIYFGHGSAQHDFTTL